MAGWRTGLGLAIVVGCMGQAPGAAAATFDVVRSGDGVVTLLDPAAIETVGQSQVRRAWSVSVQKNLVSDGPPQPGYVRTLNDYDCLQWKIRWRSFSVYSRFGALVLHKDNADPAWAPVEGNIEAMSAARIVCDGKAGEDVYAAPSIGRLVIGLMQAWDAAAPLPPLQPAPPPAKTAPHRRSRP